jgi:hypothetical protein
MFWRCGQTCSGNLRADAGGRRRSQCGAILQGDYFLHLQDTCAQGDRRSSSAEKQTSRPQVRPRPRCQDRPYDLLANLVERSRTGAGMRCASQAGGRLRPPEPSISKLLQRPADAHRNCIFRPTMNRCLRPPIARGAFDRAVNRNFSQYFLPAVAWRQSAPPLAISS